MINGAHLLLYSRDPEADRRFFRDVLELPAVDVGGGWLIFALPPSEAGIHPGDESNMQKHADRELLGAVLYLMCDDLDGTMTWLAAKGVECTEVAEAEWGRKTTLKLPGGGEVGLYQPSHDSPLQRKSG